MKGFEATLKLVGVCPPAGAAAAFGGRAWFPAHLSAVLVKGRAVSSKTFVDERPLRPGDIVEVKSATEIRATLDGEGALDKMPFMPEMARHAGRRYTVSRRVDKICDTVAATGSRRMHATVYLDDLRCDGSGHGRCEAGARSTGRKRGFVASMMPRV
jgi:hypothetical protein